MSANPATEVIESVRAFYGTESRASAWLEVKQEYMDQFATATLDPDWMHLDPERARAEGPFDGTVAFGFWTISMLTHFARSEQGADYPEGVKFGLNYGLENVRLIAPVPVGGRIRNHVRLVDISEKGEGRLLIKTENTIEVEGGEKPAMVATWLSLLFLDDRAAT